FGQVVHERVSVSPLARRFPLLPEPTWVAEPQELQPSLYVEVDGFPSSRADELPASYDPKDFKPADWKHFREVQREVWKEHSRPTTGYEAAFEALLNRSTVGEPPEAAIRKKIDDTAREKEMAFEGFRALPREKLANQRQRKRYLAALADTIAAELKRRPSEV